MTISDSRFIPSLALLYFFNRPFFFLEDAKNDTVSNSVVFVYLMLFIFSSINTSRSCSSLAGSTSECCAVHPLCVNWNWFAKGR